MYDYEDVAGKPKAQLIQTQIMAPRQWAASQLLFVDDSKKEVDAAKGCFRSHHVTGRGMGEVDFVTIYAEAGEPDALLRVAAEHIKPLFLLPYKDPPAGASTELRSAWGMDWHPQYGVQRPNHALANGVRKAMLVPLVVEAYCTHYKGNGYTGSFNLTQTQVQYLQLAILFEKCYRESDIGFFDGEEVDGQKEASIHFLGFDERSRQQFKEFATQARLEKHPFQVAFQALASMYSKPASATQHVLEVAHGLDCLRCYSAKKMKGTGEDGVLNTLEHDLGKDESHSIAVRAELMLRETGDRIYDYSPTEQGKRQYVKDPFQSCNHDVGACLRACRRAIAIAESP